ncbi:MAG TPA: glycosyltransferase family 1 protein [Chloroflexota bacterium]|nr:glycosyltransferase family 1 protein [Chloroflexota bacterium]
MKIGIDATFLEGGGQYTGMGVYTRGIARGLASVARDHEIFLLGYGPRPMSVPQPSRWEQMPLLTRGRAGRWLSHQVVLPLTARRLGLDVLHVPGVNLRLSQPGVPFWLPCPLVVTVHDAIPLMYYGVDGPPLPWRLRQGYRLAVHAARQAQIVLTVSHVSRRDVIRYLSIRPERIKVVYNGLDEPAARGEREQQALLAGLGITPPYVFYAGSYEPRKNLIGTVAAYRQALNQRDLPPLVLLVERESGHREAVLKKVAHLGITDRLHFVHSLSDEELTALYRFATLFVYPSFYEGFGFAPLQALALGVPVIASRTGALPEVLGNAARYVNPSDQNELAAAIVDLIDHPDEMAKLAERGPIQASGYRWDTAARQTLQAYAVAMGAQGANRALDEVSFPCK